MAPKNKQRNSPIVTVTVATIQGNPPPPLHLLWLNYNRTIQDNFMSRITGLAVKRSRSPSMAVNPRGTTLIWKYLKYSSFSEAQSVLIRPEKALREGGEGESKARAFCLDECTMVCSSVNWLPKYKITFPVNINAVIVVLEPKIEFYAGKWKLQNGNWKLRQIVVWHTILNRNTDSRQALGRLHYNPDILPHRQTERSHRH
ncbi:hypothetical protein B0H13DRAFT_1871767 [Mycena leptocephala]|nr:hypothetical protein B0H13DRAFT_1871767 [Mycena leptocephala]